MKNIELQLNNNLIFRLVLIFIIIIGIILRLNVYLYNQGFWGDEAMIAYNLLERNNYFDFFLPLNHYQVAPPFFLIISKIFFEIGKLTGSIYYTVMMARFIPFIASVLSIPLFCKLLNKAFNNKTLIIIALSMLSFNKAAINYAQELKQYSTELLFTIILLTAFYSIDLKKDSTLKTVCYAVLFCISPWCSFSSLFILAAGFVLIFRKRNQCKKNFLILIVPFMLNLILFYIFYKYTCVFQYPYMQTFWKDYFMPNWQGEFLIEQTHLLLSFFNNGCLYLIFPIIGFMVLFYKKHHKILFLSFFSLFACIFLSILRHYPYSLRLILFLLPIFCIIYSSPVLIIKENKVLFHTVILLSIIIALLRIKVPVSNYIIHLNDAMRHIAIIKQDKEPVLSIISNQAALFEYAHKTFKEKYDIQVKGITCDKNYVKQFQTHTKQGGIYYFSSPVSSFEEAGCISEIKKMLSTDNFEILKEYEYPYDSLIYLIKFKVK